MVEREQQAREVLERRCEASSCLGRQGRVALEVDRHDARRRTQQLTDVEVAVDALERVPSNRSSEPSSMRAAASSASSSGASGRVTWIASASLAMARSRSAVAADLVASRPPKAVRRSRWSSPAQRPSPPFRGEAVELCRRSAEGGGQRRDRGLPADRRPLDIGVRGGEGRDGRTAPILDRPHESRGTLRTRRASARRAAPARDGVPGRSRL